MFGACTISTNHSSPRVVPPPSIGVLCHSKWEATLLRFVLFCGGHFAHKTSAARGCGCGICVNTKIYHGLPGGESIFFLLFSVGVHLNFNKIWKARKENPLSLYWIDLNRYPFWGDVTGSVLLKPWWIIMNYRCRHKMMENLPISAWNAEAFLDSNALHVWDTSAKGVSRNDGKHISKASWFLQPLLVMIPLQFRSILWYTPRSLIWNLKMMVSKRNLIFPRW